MRTITDKSGNGTRMKFVSDDQLLRQFAARGSVFGEADVTQVLRSVPWPSRHHVGSLWLLKHAEHGEPALLHGVHPGLGLHQRHQGSNILKWTHDTQYDDYEKRLVSRINLSLLLKINLQST
jgi:hypothetical protein